MDNHRIKAAVQLAPPRISLKIRPHVPATKKTASIPISFRPITPELFIPILESESSITPRMVPLSTRYEPNLSPKCNTPLMGTPPHTPCGGSSIVSCNDENDEDLFYSNNITPTKPCHTTTICTPIKKQRRRAMQSRGVLYPTPRSKIKPKKHHVLQELNIIDNRIESINHGRYTSPRKNVRHPFASTVVTPKVLRMRPTLTPPPMRPARNSMNNLLSIRRRLIRSVVLVDSSTVCK